MRTQLWAMGLTLLATTMGSLGPFFLKRASSTFSLTFKGIFKNTPLLAGIAFYALGTILFIPALKGGELSVLYPLVALVYVWVSLLSMRFLGEKMNAVKWIGIILILTGVALIGIGGQ